MHRVIKALTGLVCLGSFLFCGGMTSAFQKPAREPLPNLDVRQSQSAATNSVSAAKLAAADGVRAAVPGARIDFDPIAGGPKWIGSAAGFLTGPDGQGVAPAALAALPAQDPNRTTKAFIQQHQDLFGYGSAVVDAARIRQEYVTPHNGMKTVVWEQQLDNIVVFEATLISHTTKNGELVSVGSTFLPNLATAAASGTPGRAALQAEPAIPARRAVALAARNLEEQVAEAAVVQNTVAAGEEQKQQLQAPGLTGAVEARLTWLPMNGSAMRLCWDLVLTSAMRGEMFRMLVDVQTGEVLLRRCLTAYLSSASYRVFTSDSPSPFSPGYATPVTNQPLIVVRTLETLSALDTNASPAGWINDGGNETQGNNVDAHTDRNADNIADVPRPQGSPARVFDFSMDLAAQDPTNYSPAAVVQLFYLCNWYHDKLYALGFTEAAGNFQSNNFGRGGLAGDAVQADAQDGSGTDNANFSSPPDGFAGRMQMYIFTSMNPRRDGDFDAEVVFHEFSHGLSWRLVGGGQALGDVQSDGMGEGWGDFYGMSLLSEAGDDVNGNYASGAYASYKVGGATDLSNYYYGIRRYPYSTSMAKNPLTLKDIDPAQADYCASGAPYHTAMFGTCSALDADEVHNEGEVWCVTLWDARANLVNKYGWAVGNQLMLQLVTDGMKLTPMHPNFLQARDGILQADMVDTGGANQTELWAAFAKRGMGFSATSPASSTTIGLHEAYDPPDNLRINPMTGFSSAGSTGGPFSPSCQAYWVVNVGSNAVVWSAWSTQSWVSVGSPGGTLPVDGSNSVNVCITAAANSLAAGKYSANIFFSNSISGIAQTRTVSLRVTPLPAASMADDFDPGIDAGQWSDFSVLVQANNYGGCVSAANSLWFGGDGDRYAVTRPIIATPGGVVNFWLRISNGSGYPWEMADLPGEGIVLEYSINGGTSWTQFGLYNTSTYTTWTHLSVTIPAAAQTASTLFRWRQLSNSGASFDHWALDDVSITTGSQPPSVTTQPASATVNVGGTATFNVTASGTAPLSYFWRQNGSFIAGATTSSYTTNNVPLIASGTQYSCLVSNAYGTTLSSNATLTVNGSGILSMTLSNVYYPNVLTFTFANAPTPAGPGTLKVTALADLDLTSEYLTLAAEGILSQDLFVTGGQQMIEVSTVVPLTQSQLTALAADGVITFTLTPSFDVNNLAASYARLELSYPSVNQNILLIEDQGGFGTTATMLRGHGYNVTEVTNEYANAYADLLNGAFLSGFGLVVYGERGNGSGSVLPTAAAASLESYIAAGGNVLVTGYDTLGSPTDANLANLVRAISPGDQASVSGNWLLTNLNHFILNGPYGDFRGLSFTAGGYDDDYLIADMSRGAITIARTPGESDRIIFTDVSPGGSVGYWNGGMSGTGDAQPDFHDGGIPQNLFLNWVAGVLGGGASGQAPTITAPPASQTVAVGGSATFCVTASGTAPLSYFWLRNGAPIAGATAYCYTTNNVQLAGNGSQFSCLVSNAYGTALSSSATLSVTTNLPTESVMPLPPHQSTYAGLARGFWFTAPRSFVITGVEVPAEAGAGNQSIAIVRFNSGVPPTYPNTTNDFTVLFLTQNNPATAKIAANIPVTPGQCIGVMGVRGDVNSYGAGPYTSDILGTPVTLTRMGMQYALSSTAPQDLWQEPGGSISRVMVYVSSTASQPPSITSQPTNQAVAVGGTATFSVTASGTAPLSYFWRRNGTPIAGATAASYTTNNVQLADSGSLFSCLVSNAYGTMPSANATLTVLGAGTNQIVFFPLNTDPGWSRQGEWAFGMPTGQGGIAHGYHDPTSGYTGANVFGVKLTGDYTNTIGGPNYLTAGPFNFSAYTNVTLQFQRWLNTDYEPYVYATIDVSSNGTAWKPIWSNGVVTISDTNWTRMTYNLGAYANNQPTVYVRWGHEVRSGSAFMFSGWNLDDIEFLGSSSTASTVSNILVFNDVSSASPFAIALTNLGLTHQCFSNSQEVLFTAAVASANPANTLVIVNAPGNTHTFSNLPAYIAGGGRAVMEYYYLEGLPSVAAAFQVTTVQDFTLPLPVYDWGNTTLFTGLSSPLSFTDSYIDDGDKLQPLAGGQAVAGFVSSTTSNQAAIVIGNAGRTIVNGFLLEESTPSASAVQLARNELQLLIGSTPGNSPLITAQPSNQSVPVGGSTTYSVTASGSAPLSYFWRRNGSPIAGATASSYTTNNVQLADSGSLFSCLVSNAYGTALSSNATLTVTVGGTILTINAADTGWYDSTGRHDPANANYGCGDSLSVFYRDWFVFTVPGLTNTVSSAELLINCYTNSSPSGMETYELRQVSTSIAQLVAGGSGLTTIYNDLGDGPLYGSRDVYVAESGQVISVPLNGNFINALMAAGGGQIALGGSISTLDATPANETLFGYSLGNPGDVRLRITLANNSTVVTTTNSWNGVNAISTFGEPDTATYGQTFTVTNQITLNSFTLYLQNQSGTNYFAFYVMAWDGAKATGPILYASPATSSAGKVGMQPYTFVPGNLPLVPGTYVAFICASPFFDGNYDMAAQGAISGNVYSGGGFYFFNNGAAFSSLTNAAWDSSYNTWDAAFVAVFGGGAGGAAPNITVQPGNQLVGVGGAATFNVGASGTAPLTYSWRRNGKPIAGASVSSYTTNTVCLADSGAGFSCLVSNSYGSILSSNGMLTVLNAASSQEFQIISLTTNNSLVVDHSAFTGDDRGGIAISPTHFFYSGDSSTARFSATNLADIVSLGIVYDALFSDLRSGKVYSLADSAGVLTALGGTATRLLEHDGATGALNGRSVALSAPIPLTSVGNVGIFSGFGRLVVHNGSRVYDVALPSGLVTDRGPMSMPSHTPSENWAFWGVTEYFGGSLYCTYVRDTQTITRTRVPDGTTTVLASFSNLSDMACFTVWPGRNRWYFHHEYDSQFGGSAETAGYADATFNYGLVILPLVQSAGQIQFSIPTVVGRSYVVEYKNDLTDTVWIPQQTNMGDGTVQSVTRSTTVPAKRFFRVRTQ